MLDYWDYDAQASLTCPICAWSGRGEGLEDTFKEVMDVKCPQCDHMLLVITYPTIEQTRAAAAAGNEIAQQELRHLECPQGRAQKPSAFDAEQVSAAAPGSTEVPCGTGNPDQADVGGS
jgi:hypothetical protein